MTAGWTRKPPTESSTYKRKSPRCAGPFACCFTTFTMRMIAPSQYFEKRLSRPTGFKVTTTSQTNARRGIATACAKRWRVFLTRSSPTMTRQAAWPIRRPRARGLPTKAILTLSLPDHIQHPPTSALGGKRTLNEAWSGRSGRLAQIPFVAPELS